MLDKNDFRAMYGSGGYDMCDEWVWSGNYYQYITRPKTNHNYYINFYRLRGKNHRTKGWSASICQSFNCINSGELSIGRLRDRTLKGVINKVVECINDYDKDLMPKIMIDWLNEHKQAVFIIRDGEPIVVGGSFGSTGCDMDDFFDENKRDKWRYYHKDMPDYNKYRHVFTLQKSIRDDEEYLWQCKHHGCGRSEGGIRDEEFVGMGITISRVEFMNKVKELHETYINDMYIASIRQKC